MADELTSPESTPVEPSAEQAAPASQPAPQSDKPEVSQPAQEPSSDNWQDDPRFKEFQRNYNKSLNDSRQQNQMLQAQLGQLQQELESVRTRDMTEEELYQHELMKRDAAYGDLQQHYNQLYHTYSKELAMAEIARRAGVEPSVFAEAETPDEAWETALQVRLEREKEAAEARYKADIASTPGNSPDLGTGRTGSAPPSLKNETWEDNTGLRDFYRRKWDEYQDG